MFDPTDRPRVFGLPLGADFPKALVDGLIARHKDQPPETLARVTVIVNTQRMARRIRDLFDAGPPMLLPRIQVITDLGQGAVGAGIPPAVPALRRRLELSQLIGTLLEKEPDLASRAALFDLSDSLAALMDEMHGEGVSPGAISALDVSDQSGHSFPLSKSILTEPHPNPMWKPASALSFPRWPRIGRQTRPKTLLSSPVPPDRGERR